MSYARIYYCTECGVLDLNLAETEWGGRVDPCWNCGCISSLLSIARGKIPKHYVPRKELVAQT